MSGASGDLTRAGGGTVNCGADGGVNPAMNGGLGGKGSFGAATLPTPNETSGGLGAGLLGVSGGASIGGRLTENVDDANVGS